MQKRPVLQKSMSIRQPTSPTLHGRNSSVDIVGGASGKMTAQMRDNIGEDFLDRFAGLNAKSADYRLRADQEQNDKEHIGLVNTNAAAGNSVHPPGRRDSRSASAGDELEELYVEVLYTIKHKIGQAEQFQYMCDNDELLDYVQKAFAIDNVRHQRLLSKANQEKFSRYRVRYGALKDYVNKPHELYPIFTEPPKVLLNITVMEARDLEAKDPNGFSDPYCMLGLIGHKSRKQLESMSCSTMAENNSPEEKESSSKSRKSALYRSTRTKSKRDCNAEILEQLPAKFIRTTTVKSATLNPVWNESFQLVVDNVNEDILHLDVFDYDAEYEVMDALRNVKNVQGIKGLNRYFKQIAQSARKSAEDNVDDFLGCVDVKIMDVPSIAMDKVFTLYTRAVNRARLSGTIRLRMNLSTREDRNQTFGNNLTDFLQHRELMTVFMKTEVKRGPTSLEWNGELGDLAEAVLHQHAVQGDLSELQQAACSWISLTDVHVGVCRLDYLVLFQALKHLDSLWLANGLATEAEEVLAEAVGQFKDYAFACLEKQKYYFPMGGNMVGPKQLESLLKCLRLLYGCKLFKRYFPLDVDLEEAITNVIKAAADDYYGKIRLLYLSEIKPDENVSALESLSEALIAVNYDLRKYFRLAEKVYAIFKIRYFAITVTEIDRLANDDLEGLIVFRNIPDCSVILDNKDPYVILKEDFFTAPGREEPNPDIFILYLALNDLLHFRKDLTDDERLVLRVNKAHRKFIPFVLQWFSYAKVAAKRKMKSFVESDKKVSRAESIVRYSASVVDSDTCISQMTRFVMDLKWPDDEQNLIFMCKLMNDVAEEAAYFSELTYRAFKDSGWCEHELLEVNDDLCIAVNNLEMMRLHLSDLPGQLGYLDSIKQFRETSDPVLVKFATDCETILVQSLINGQKMLTDRITNALEKMMKKMNGAVTRLLAKLLNNTPTSAESLAAPLIQYLDGVLANLYPSMLKTNFLRFLEVLWLNILDQILVVTLNNRSREPICFVNLYQSFGIFIDYLGGAQGLPKQTLENEHYHSVRRKVFYNQLSTAELIDSFLTEAVNVQAANPRTPYGSITVRSHYDRKSGKVILEIIHARDVIPMDTNGLSDPFVIIRFLPLRLFSGMQTGRTAIVKKCLDPDFDERFEFSVPMDKCKKDCAMIQLTLMDHDIMFQDEIAGEAFIQLHRLPGMKGEQTKNFAGLQEITVPMLHPKMMTKGILADIIDVIKCRENQKDGPEFLAHLFV